MLRRLIVLAGLTAGMSVAAVIGLATPALAKGPIQVRITGPGLAHPVVIAGVGEPGQMNRLAVLATQTDLYSLLFGAGGSVPAPVRLSAPPSAATLGPRYTIVYTMPGVPAQPGQEFGRIRQDLYPQARGGPVIYVPPGQQGFGQPLLATGWLRGSHQLEHTLAQLGVRSQPDSPAAGASAPATWVWLIVAAAAVAVAALAVTVLRHRRPRAMTQADPSAGARP
jgi:hypothetical protein